MALTVTFDLEDNRHSDAQQERFAAMSLRFLEFVEQRGIAATVFIVGEIARTHPELVRRVAAGGHEVGLHGLHHVPLAEVGRERLGQQVCEGRDLLEQVAGVPVLGFRAPIFSLTPSTRWAVDALLDAGFLYSSSVLPAANPMHGWPGAPETPFRWRNGLLELPCPLGGWGRMRIPFLGGVYLRYVPRALVRRWLGGGGGGGGSSSAAAALWSYTHPYDLDADEPYFVMPHTGRLASRLLHARRGATLARLDAAIEAAGGAGPPLVQIAQELVRADLQPAFC